MTYVFVPFTLNAHSTNSKIVLHCSKHCYFVDYYSCCSFRINSRECCFDVDTITASAAVEEEGGGLTLYCSDRKWTGHIGQSNVAESFSYFRVVTPCVASRRR